MRISPSIAGILLLALVSLADAASVRLAWEAPTTNVDGSPVTDLGGYWLYQRRDGEPYGGPVQTIAAPTTTATVTNLQPGVTYFWVVTAFDTGGNESAQSNEVSFSVPAAALPGTATNLEVTWQVVTCTERLIDFDQPSPGVAHQALLNGIYQGIDWGQGQWRWEGPYGPNPSGHVYFDSASGTSRSFRLVEGVQILRQLRAFSTIAGTLTLADDRGQQVTQAIGVGSLIRVVTGWQQPSRIITVTFTEGWALGLDDFVLGCTP